MLAAKGGKPDERWGSLTCERLAEMADIVQEKIKERKAGKGKGLEFEKLTHNFWRNYIRRETLKAGGERAFHAILCCCRGTTVYILCDTFTPAVEVVAVEYFGTLERT